MDRKSHPDGPETDRKPKNQASEQHGTISSAQIDGHKFRERNLPRGSEGDNRRRSGISR